VKFFAAHIYWRGLLVLPAILFFFYTGNAQIISDSLREVQIEARQKKELTNEDKINIFSPGQKLLLIDTLVLQQYKFQNLASLISQQTSAFVKSYGFNGLATLNFRGSSAAQSQVYWNGIPLQNAALGISDISTLPVAMVDRVSILYGGSSALWGSGNVGGALMLENDRPVFDSSGHREASVSLAAGSFSQYMGGAKLAFGNRRWFVSANAFGQSASNNFRFTDASGQKQLQDNSGLSSLGIMLNAAYRFGAGSVLSISGWYQHFNREIPAALFEPYSLKSRYDLSRRLMLHWYRQQRAGKIYLRTSIIEDRLYFNDYDSIGLQNNNISYQSYNELGWAWNFGQNKQLLIFLPLNYTWMEQGRIYRSQLRTGLSAAFSAGFIKNKLNIALQASQQFVDSTSIFLPGIGCSLNASKWLIFNLNIQRTYRAATLNELYYSPGGNPSLNPEQGWAGEIGYVINTDKNKTLYLSQSSSTFYRDIRDWIIWYGGAIWTPQNVARVHSRGLETENMLHYRRGNYLFHLGLNTAYIIATTKESYLPGDGSIGKQIPYAPRYNGQLNLGFSFKGLYFNYNHSYTGYRFSTTDESSWVEPYSIANLQMSYRMVVGRAGQLHFSAQCNNIFNVHYQVVAQRPVPGINWLAGLKFQLHD
jgi:vitamin B12 transporter